VSAISTSPLRILTLASNVAGLTGITVGNYTAALILPEDGAWVRLPYAPRWARADIRAAPL
jgi:hypothetical protein